MPNSTVPAAAPGLPADHKPLDPVVALIARWKEANARWKGDPSGVSEEWMQETFGTLNADMKAAPAAVTLPGAIAALQLLLDEREGVEDILDWEIICGLVNATLNFLRSFTVPEVRPATRAEMEAYRAWLHMEGRILAGELYPEMGHDAERFILANTGAEDLHFPPRVSWEDLPKPSSRAVRVLTAVGANFAEIARRGAENDGMFGRGGSAEATVEVTNG